MQAAHRPRRAGHADRLGGHHRRAGPSVLPGEGIPPAGDAATTNPGPPKQARRDGSLQSRTTRRLASGAASHEACLTQSMTASQPHSTRRGRLTALRTVSLGTRRSETSPPGRGEVRLEEGAFGDRPSVLHYMKRRTTHMNLGDFIDNVQGRHCQKGGGVLPAPLPPHGERRHAPQAAPKAPGGAGRRHQGRGPLPQGPPGHHGRRRDGHRQDLHRRGGGAHGRFRAHPHASARPTWCPSGSGRWR